VSSTIAIVPLVTTRSDEKAEKTAEFRVCHSEEVPLHFAGQTGAPSNSSISMTSSVVLALHM